MIGSMDGLMDQLGPDLYYIKRYDNPNDPQHELVLVVLSLRLGIVEPHLSHLVLVLELQLLFGAESLSIGHNPVVIYRKNSSKSSKFKSK